MSTTPQMSQQQGHQHNQPDQQQGPSTAPPQPFSQQPWQQFGQQPQQPFGQHPFGQQQPGQQQTPPQMSPQQMGQQVPQHLRQQLQQIGQQQPFQQLLQQLGGQQQGQLPGQMPGQGQPPVPMSGVASQALVSGTAQHFWDVVTPLPGQPSVLHLFIDNAWRPLVNPDRVTHDAVRQAFAHGQQVVGVYDGNSNTVQAVIVNQ
ncbi:hypothetical protein OHB41_12130 [Streptomyces sp. NBC_01571]|uniref:hypothetical protein n=1 Tax=Streptomyces sp. NBC_01571 TaxID=2975883 RepID=UPI0022544718|nr:hypothetical protein [Streptomyces sp. NBC_01571]MCX4573915.1 hypothetical protein [Streptomyces sp. NBC_01571]